MTEGKISGQVSAVYDTAKMYKVVVGSATYYGWLNSKPAWLKPGCDVALEFASDPDKMSGKPIIKNIVDLNKTDIQQESIDDRSTAGGSALSINPSTPVETSSNTPSPSPSSNIHVETMKKMQAHENKNFAKELATIEVKLKEFPNETEREQYYNSRVLVWFHNLNALDTRMDEVR